LAAQGLLPSPYCLISVSHSNTKAICLVSLNTKIVVQEKTYSEVYHVIASSEMIHGWLNSICWREPCSNSQWKYYLVFFVRKKKEILEFWVIILNFSKDSHFLMMLADLIFQAYFLFLKPGPLLFLWILLFKHIF
jgi:hypothetical protein